MIRLKDVEMEYPNGTRAIRGISAAIEDGEFVFLVGPSGSGKSTIIKMLTGEEIPTAVGMPKKEIKQRITYVLQLVGLEKKAENFPSELSGGEQQRVAIARALVNNPATIIADEPTGNLDPERSMEIMTLLVKINQLGTTVVVVTHEKDLVNKFGKRVITIDQGRIINDSVGGYVGGHIHE